MPGLIWTTKYHSVSFQEIMNEIICKNKFLCRQKKTVFRRDIFSNGLLEIGATLSCNNATIFTYTNLLLNPDKSFCVMSIIDSIPAQWRTIVKGSSSLPIIPPVPHNPPLSLSMKFLWFFCKPREFQYKVLDCNVLKKWKTLSFWYYAITILYTFRIRYLLNFGNKYCPGSGTATLMLENWRKLFLIILTIFDNFDIEDDSTLINHILSFGK